METTKKQVKWSFIIVSLVILFIGGICGTAEAKDNSSPAERRYGVRLTMGEGGAPSTQGLTLSNPYWDMTLDAAGYSDYLGWGYSPRPHVTGEMLSGEWGAAIYYDGISTAPNAMWLTNQFIYPDWTTNSNFQIFQNPNAWDDPCNPVNGIDTGYSVIRNGQVEVRIDYEVVDLGEQDPNTGVGGSPLAFRDANGMPVFVYSERYVLLQTYTIKNIQTDVNVTGLEFYQMVCGFWMNRSVYETTIYYDPLANYVPHNSVHKVGNFHYDITQWNSGYNNWIGFSSTVEPNVAPKALDNGPYGAHSGTALRIEQRILNGEPNGEAGGYVGGATGRYLGTLKPNESISMTLAVMLGAKSVPSFCPPLTLKKVDDVNDCVGPGDEINYRIDYNYPAGPNCPDINDVNIIDYLPDEVEFVSSVPEPNEIIDSNIIWHIGTLSPGESGYVTLKVKVKCAKPGGTITNCCKIKSGDEVRSIACEDTLVCSPMLTKVDNITGCVSPGNDVNYSICYAANGYGDTNVVITDDLPNNVDFVSASGDYEYISGTITWDIGTLDPNESGCVMLKVKVKPCVEPDGTITNCCEMTGDCMTTPVTACENTNVCGPPTLTKEDDVPEGSCVAPDANITYSICYAANGYGDKNVVITDSLPPEVNFVWASDGGAYNPGNHTVTWDIGTLGPNGSNCLTLTVKVNENVVPCEMITNCCEMEGDCLHDITACEDTRGCWGVIYVDVDANGLNNGTSWKDAYNYLRDALEDANISPGCEVRVAEGIYRPDDGAGVEPNDRDATFELINCVGIRGGYAGFGFPDPNARKRNIREYETILSGDLKGNDRQGVDPYELLDDPCRADNSYHVVTGSGTNSSAILDGFTITGGNANGAYGSNHSYGGGMYNYGSSPTVTNCTFIGNSAYKCGGGMYNDGSSSPTVRNCIFNGNYNYDIPFTWSGGMYNDGGSSPTVTNCLFKNNVTLGIYGGGNVTNCILWGNGWGEISGDASVTYSDIEIEGEGVYTGVGNINADPMFAADGYHLTLCSLCIDAGTNTPPGGLPEEDIDGEERIMGCADEPRVDMGVDEYYTSDCNVFLRAHCPKPACGTADVPRDVVLCWRPGVDANKHDVYFGTDRTAVINANDPYTPPGRGRQDSNCYDPCTDDPNQCYYWRIDEVNDANIWRGDVWYFRVVPDCNVVENFNSYTEDTLGEVWKDHWNQEDPITQSWLYLKLGIDDANFVRGGKDSNSIRYAYENHLSPWYSEAYADIDYLPSQIGRDWTANGVKALVLWFYGQASNPVTEQMYIKLTDGDGDSGTVMYGDMSDIKEPEWHKWSIDLALFDARGVNLANVSRITIGFGDGIAPGYDGLVYIEDIQLCAGKCLGECAPEYADWVAWGKPNCWCFKRQCRGDADGVKTGGVWVQTYDLNLLKSAFNKADTIVKNIPNGICADLNHAKTGGVRVQTLDLNILKSFFNKAETSVPCCDADKDGTLTTLDKYNFWTN